jgi:hypothetical protein
MKTWLIRFAIVAAILVQALWAFQYRNLDLPRSAQTIAAIHAYQTSPSADTKAAMIAQMDRDASRNIRRGRIILGLMVVADVAVIYLLWNHGVRKIGA